MNNNYQEAHQNEEISTFGNPQSLLHWLLNLLIYTIPIVNIVFLIIWALGAMGTGEIKKNFAIAHLVLCAIFVAFFILLIIIQLIREGL